MWENGPLGGGLHSPSAFLCRHKKSTWSLLFHINCISLWMIIDRSSSWMSEKLRSLYKMCRRWRTSWRQPWSSPGSNGASGAQRAISTRGNLQSDAPKQQCSDESICIAGRKSQWFPPDLLRCRLLLPWRPNGSGNCGKVAGQPPKQNYDAWSRRSEPEMPNDNCLRVSEDGVHLTFICLAHASSVL